MLCCCFTVSVHAARLFQQDVPRYCAGAGCWLMLVVMKCFEFYIRRVLPLPSPGHWTPAVISYEPFLVTMAELLYMSTESETTRTSTYHKVITSSYHYITVTSRYEIWLIISVITNYGFSRAAIVTLLQMRIINYKLLKTGFHLNGRAIRPISHQKQELY